MTIYLGDFPTGKTIYVPFHTFNSSGASVTITGLAVTDIEVYRNGSVTQRASDAGYALLDTDGIDFDALTGIHGFSIDTSDNTDAGFYAAGYDYWVVVSAITVDAQTVSFVAAIFSIDNRQLLRPTVASRTLDVSAGGEAGVDWANVGSPTTTLNLSGTSTKALEPTTAGRTLDVTATGEAGIDWANIGSPTTTVNLSGTSTKALEPTTAGRTLDVTTTGEAGLDFANVNIPAGQVAIAQILDNGTMQAGSAAGTAVLRSGLTVGADDRLIGATIWITGGTGANQRRLIHANVNTTDTVSIAPNWDATPDNTSTYIIYPTPPASTNSAVQPAVASVTGAVGSVTGNVGGNVVGSVGSVTGAVGSVTGNVGGNVTGSVGSVATGGITAASIATGAFDADALATDAVTEIVTGVLTSAMTEAYPTDGSTMTVAQALYLIAQSIGEFSVSGTTVTVKKVDGTTTAATYTLDSSTAPTSRTRAT